MADHIRRSLAAAGSSAAGKVEVVVDRARWASRNILHFARGGGTGWVEGRDRRLGGSVEGMKAAERRPGES